MSNAGQGLLLTVDNTTKPSINITGGPLSYKYELHQIAVHFGMSDDVGSEHTIANKSLPAEVSMQTDRLTTHINGHCTASFY